MPANADEILPNDVDTLRYALRTDGNAGFIFINNYQDHMETKDQEDFSITIKLDNEQIRIPKIGSVSLTKNESCILPFNLDLDGCTIKYSTTQFITSLEHDDEWNYYFFVPKGMTAEYCFDEKGISTIQVADGTILSSSNKTLVTLNEKDSNMVHIELTNGKIVHLCTMSNLDAINFWKFSLKGRDRVMITDATLLVDEERVRFESVDQSRVTVKVFPKLEETAAFHGCEVSNKMQGRHFQEYELNVYRNHNIDLDIDMVSDSKAEIQLPSGVFDGVKELLLNIDYVGDIGYAFIDGELIHDNFCNGRTWEIGLKEHQNELMEKGMYIYISPLKEGSFVRSDSPMAGRSEVADKQVVEIRSIDVTAVMEFSLSIS